MPAKALVLGAGRVAGPCVHYLLRQDYQVTVVSSIQHDLDEMAKRCPQIVPVNFDLTRDQQKLSDLVAGHDVIVVLLPHHLLPHAVKCCIQHGKNAVTASYVDEDLRSLEESIQAANITVLTECGLDPGIDHMLAMTMIDDVKSKGGTVNAYTSLCGGLPAPECSNGPFRYKFSWFPRGMLASCVRPASYFRNGKMKHLDGHDIFDHVELVPEIIPGSEIESIPNHGGLAYSKLYDLPTAKSFFRGTLRYKGFVSQMKALVCLGLLSDQPHPQLQPSGPRVTWREFVCGLADINPASVPDELLPTRLAESLNLDIAQLDDIREIGLLSKDLVPQKETPIDSLASYMPQKMAYASDERDMVIMRNVLEVTMPSGQRQRHRADIVKYGDIGGFSAMSSTTGLTAGVSAHMLAQGFVKRSGIQLPLEKDIYDPVLKELIKERLQIRFSQENM